MFLRPLQSHVLTFLPPSPVLPLHLPRFKKTVPTIPKSRLQIEIVTLAKRTSKDALFEPSITELTKRMSPHLSVTSRWIKREQTLRILSDLIDSHRRLILLDPQGLLPRDSRHFAQLVFDELQFGGSRLVFVIGDADGFSKEVRELQGRAGVRMMSLSPLTFTHKMVSAFLILFSNSFFFICPTNQNITCVHFPACSRCLGEEQAFCARLSTLTNLSQVSSIMKKLWTSRRISLHDNYRYVHSA